MIRLLVLVLALLLGNGTARHESSALGRRDVHGTGTAQPSVMLEQELIHPARMLLGAQPFRAFAYPYPICCPAGKAACNATYSNAWPTDTNTGLPQAAELAPCCRLPPVNQGPLAVPNGNEVCVPASVLQANLPAGLSLGNEPLDPSYYFVACKRGKCLCRQGNSRQCVDNNGNPACVLQQANVNPLVGPFNQYTGAPCCRNGWKDCNGQANDGCEIDTMNDVDNCGCCSSTPAGDFPACKCDALTETCKAGKCGCRFGFKPCKDGLKTKCIPKDKCCPANGALDCPGQHDHCSEVGGECVCDVDPTGARVWADCETDILSVPETMGCETDLQTSDQHCGACGNDCGCAKTCKKGVCECDTPNYGKCPNDDTTCFDLSLDAHCGPDCKECDKGRQCQWDGSNWGCACPDGPTPDSFLTDPDNCGVCGHTCNVDAGEICDQGVCKCETGKKMCGDAGCQACCVDADCGDPLKNECDTITKPATYECKDKCLHTSCTSSAGVVECCDQGPLDNTNPAICINDKCAYCAAPNHWCNGSCVECCGNGDCGALEFCDADHTCKDKCLTVSCTNPKSGETQCCTAGSTCVLGECSPCGGGTDTRCDTEQHQIWDNAMGQCKCTAGYTNCGSTTLDCKKCCAPEVECGGTCCDTSKGQTCDAATKTCVCNAAAPTPLKNCAAAGKPLDCKACCSPLCQWKDALGFDQSKCCDTDPVTPNVGCYPEKDQYCAACAAGYRFCPNNPELGCSRCCPGTNDGCPKSSGTDQYVCQRPADDLPYDCVLNGCRLFTTCIENQTPAGNSHVCKIKQNNGQGDCDACTADNNLACPEDYVCDNGKCKYAKSCASNDGCPHGFDCVTSVCTVIAACTTTAQCPVGLACNKGDCK